MKASIIGRIRNTNLPRTKALLPLFEAVVNSFHAIEEVKGHSSPLIRIEATRERLLDKDELGEFESFAVIDNGSGFNDANYESFETVDTQYKHDLGGKGLGRFSWLKAFDHVEINSHYRDGDGLKHRAFCFLPREEESDALPEPSSEAEPRTTVRLVGFKSPYKESCPKELGAIAQRLIEHFLPLFLDPACPRLSLTDGPEEINLNRYFEDNFRASASAHTFEVQGAPFSLRGFRLYNTADRHHRILYAAHYRGVITERLDKHLPNLSGKIEDEDRGSFAYLAFVEGEKLDTYVNSERTSFSFPVADDEDQAGDTPQSALLAGELSLKLIREQALGKVTEDLKLFLDEINAAKQASVDRYINEEAPQYRPLRRYMPEFIDSIPPNPTPRTLEMTLHEQLYRKQRELKQESHKIIEESAPAENIEEYAARFRDFMERFNELGTSALAQYVLHRKIILDLFEKALQRDPNTGRYSLEKTVHNIVFPMRTTSDDVPFAQQNLWIIDERLTYHSFLSSDKPLKSLEPIDNPSDSRPDILIFDRPLAFGEDGQPLTSIVVVEFKRPDRDDYRDEDPISQVYRMIRDVRDGKMKDSQGRWLRTASSQIPSYAYIICDLTPDLETRVQNMGAFRTPDNQGYYGFNLNLNAYYEIISYNKLLGDARKRNRVLFDKLNIPVAAS
jgi:hypothetical protein